MNALCDPWNRICSNFIEVRDLEILLIFEILLILDDLCIGVPSDLSIPGKILQMNHTQIFWKNWKNFNIDLRHPKNWCVWGEYWVSQQRTAAARGKKLPGACHLSCKKAPLYHQKLPQKYCLRNSFESKVSHGFLKSWKYLWIKNLLNEAVMWWS